MPGLLKIYAVSRRLYKTGWKRAALFLKVTNGMIHGADISPVARLGRVRIPHPFGVVIGADVQIGDETIVMSGVVLGRRGIYAESGAPVVGRSCTLGTGAKILGPVVLGDGVVVGANSVVLQSFPNNVLIAGAPARVVRALPRSVPWQ